MKTKDKLMKKAILGIVLALTGILNVPRATAAKDNFELIKFTTEDGASIQGALFKANSNKVVIFAHGAIFDKKSWYFLAEKFQARNVAGLSIDFRGYGNSEAGSTNKKMYDILGAISYLKAQGYNDINIVGGSMGGAAVLAALTLAKKPINKVVLLAPADGPPIKSDKTDKFFVVSKGEGLYNRVKSIYNNSAEPKHIKEYSGRAHAQHMFKEDYKDELEALILDFIGQA
jgi:alpha-beta hydrolase superfamily lysophospholipase